MIVADDIAAKGVASRRVTVGRCDLGDSSSVGLALADLEVALTKRFLRCISSAWLQKIQT